MVTGSWKYKKRKQTKNILIDESVRETSVSVLILERAITFSGFEDCFKEKLFDTKCSLLISTDNRANCSAYIGR